MGIRTTLDWLAIGVALGSGVGCSSTPPIKSWQQRLTSYTMQEAGGDLNVLRESAELRSTEDARPAQIRFDSNDLSDGGSPIFGNPQDAHGVLVGQHMTSGQPMFFFLVGVIDRPTSGRNSEVNDIRLVSCIFRNGRHHWKTSRFDVDALSAYRQGSQGNDRANPDVGGRIFPLVDDHFDFVVSGRMARVTDTHSNASWELPLD